MCLIHSSPEQRHSSVTEMKYGSMYPPPPCSEHLTSVWWYQIRWSSREQRKCAVGENMTDTQTDRQKEVPNGVWVPFQTHPGHSTLLWVRCDLFVVFFLAWLHLYVLRPALTGKLPPFDTGISEILLMSPCSHRNVTLAGGKGDDAFFIRLWPP